MRTGEEGGGESVTYQLEENSMGSRGSASELYMRVARSVLRHYPLNTPRISLLGKLPAVPAKCCPFSVKGGLTIHACHAGNADIISKSLYWLGDFDPWVIALLKTLATSASIALDIGANIGAMSLQLSRFVGATGKVISIEPFSPNLELLKQNVAGNRCENIEIVGIALSDREGFCRIGMADGQPGHASVVEGDSSADGIEVQMRTLDELLCERGVRKVSVCKIDVEGYEPAVFAGAQSALANHVIESFVFERLVNGSFRDDSVFSFLRANGYRVWKVWKHYRGVSLVEPGIPFKARATDDFVAIAKGSNAEALAARYFRTESH